MGPQYGLGIPNLFVATVCVGMDLIEEALYSVTAGTRGNIDSLWTITAFSLPRYDLRDGARLLTNLKFHSQTRHTEEYADDIRMERVG